MLFECSLTFLLCAPQNSVTFSPATQFWRHKIADIAKKFPEITFAVADDEENSDLMKQFGLDESGEDLNLGLYGADGKKYAMEPMDDFDSDDIIDFLKKYKKGESETIFMNFKIFHKSYKYLPTL